MVEKVAVFDIEADGLLDVATRVHCGVVSNLKGDDVRSYLPHQIPNLLKDLGSCDVLIGHNILGYDLPLLESLYGFKYRGKVVDTLVMSRLQKPDRRLPPHAKDKRAGGHGLYAWGVRLGHDKVDVAEEEWAGLTKDEQEILDYYEKNGD